jgi:hypothetical protein
VRRYVLLALTRKLLPEERVCWCLRRFVSQASLAEIWVADNHERAHLKKVMVCGLVWVCVVCSSKISARRAEELSSALAKSGLTAFLGTITLQHNRESQLGVLVEDLCEGYRYLKSGLPWQRFCKRWEIVGTITNLECTYGDANGFHPHKHILFLSTLPREVIDNPQTRLEMLETMGRYGRYLEKRGYLVNDHTVNVKTGVPEVERYLTKWSLELEVARSEIKAGRQGHYTPFQLLDLIDQGKTQYIPVFQEYAKVFKGRNQLVWSRGLRDRLVLGKEKDDKELMEEGDEMSYLLMTLDYGQWKQLLRFERRGAIGQLLNIASSGDVGQVWAYLVSLGITPTDAQLDRVNDTTK